jgi:hypothetical protein
MPDFNTDLLQLYLDRFCNRRDVYSRQYANQTRYWYQPVWEPVTMEVIEAHLRGEVTAAWYCTNPQNECKWLAFDFDDDCGNREKLANVFRQHGWRRPGRDGHLWLFFDEPVDAALLRQFAKLFLKQVGINEKSVEVFPKQDKVNIGGLGNAVRGPLGIHRKPGANKVRGWFDDIERDLTTQLQWFANQQPNKAQYLVRLAEEIQRRAIKPLRVPARRHRQISIRYERIDWIEYAELNSFRTSGDWWHGPCPSCRASGHDRSGSHLSVSKTGWVGCFRGCSFEDILMAVS